jgi:hypothetical protein
MLPDEHEKLSGRPGTGRFEDSRHELAPVTEPLTTTVPPDGTDAEEAFKPLIAGLGALLANATGPCTADTASVKPTHTPHTLPLVTEVPS